MNLKEYLQAHNLSQTQVARELEFSREYICDVINGRQPCSKKTARALSRFTHGVVPVEDILKLYKERKRTETECT